MWHSVYLVIFTLVIKSTISFKVYDDIDHPNGLFINSNNDLFVANTDDYKVLKILQSGTVTRTVFAGTGDDGTNSAYDGNLATEINMKPSKVWGDISDNIYITDQSNARVYKVTSSGILTVFAGNGQSSVYGGQNVLATTTPIKYPSGIGGDTNGNIYFSDAFNIIRKVATDNIITNAVGDGASTTAVDNVAGSLSGINLPAGLWVDNNSNLYFVDSGNRLIRKIDGITGIVNTVAGSGTTGQCLQTMPGGLTVGASKNALQVHLYQPIDIWGDTGSHLYILDSADLTVTQLDMNVATPTLSYYIGESCSNAALSSNLFRIDGETGTDVRLSDPRAIAGSSDGSVYYADNLAGSGSRVNKGVTPDAVKAEVNTEYVTMRTYSPSFAPTSGPKSSSSSSTSIIIGVVVGVVALIVLLFLVVYFARKSNKPKVVPEQMILLRHKSERIEHTPPIISDVFLTHDWGVDEAGRNNHDRVRKINAKLKELGVVTWFDEEQLSGNVLQQMTEGIDNTKCVVVFITERYMNKVNSNDGRDNCQFEFEYAFRQLGPHRIIPVVMESRMRDPKKWVGVFGGALGGMLYIDMSEDRDSDAFTQDCTRLKNRVLPIVQMPLESKQDKNKHSEAATTGTDNNKQASYGAKDKIVTDSRFTSSIAISDHAEHVAVKTDVFLTHDWGTDELGRDNHIRVARVNDTLKSLGMVPWFDAEQLTGKVLSQMTEGIDNTKCVVVFITERYMNKVNGPDGRDNCQYEFNYAFRQLGPHRIIPVVMESRMLASKTWNGVFGGSLGGMSPIDLVSDDPDHFSEQCEQIRRRVMEASC